MAILSLPLVGRVASRQHQHHEFDEESGPKDHLHPDQADCSKIDTHLGAQTPAVSARSRSVTHHYHHLEHDHLDMAEAEGPDLDGDHSRGHEHHHHVPTNAFMSIGLQTSLAIALHKAPEGFITYATNHANPTLGFSVFMALFIHNITEGFVMALPLYLALQSRLKAILWATFLGGASQPLGAAVAALWFKLANRTPMGAPDEAVYGGMFAVTSGVMTSNQSSSSSATGTSKSLLLILDDFHYMLETFRQPGPLQIKPLLGINERGDVVPL
ncbi:hypothetical protein DV737_g2413, partial [Chaetothyriales sp. CBS 132003]